MVKTWFSYVLLATGLMMLMASDKNATADDKQSFHTVSYGTEQKMEILVDQDGTEDPSVKLIINGEEYNFSMPEVTDGEDKVITTEDGKKIIIKAVSGTRLIEIDGEEMHLPSFGKHKITADGLSAMIGRSHHLKLNNDITISANGVSEDVKSAIIDAVQGVLASYDVDKKVSFSDNRLGLHMLTKDSLDGNTANFEFKIKSDFHTKATSEGGEEVIVIDIEDDDSND